jgi:SAM-dependent MidA family methyltransferase
VSPLDHLLLQKLAQAPRLTFAEVMELALYHEEHGYYGPGPRRIGRSGDFYTAVSVGRLYGQLLADLARQTWADLGKPEGFCVIEQAAHDGQLAEDILSCCDFDYVIVEPNPRYEAVQRERLTAFGERVSWVRSLAELPAWPALFVCNELPDAMPVHLVQWDGAGWRELFVVAEQVSGSQLPVLGFQTGEPSEMLRDELARLPSDLPAGYTTEVNLAALAWTRDLAAAPFHGRIYIADYGLDHEELYSTERTTGTLRRYCQHQTDDRVLENLGGCDLTTHVNFTRLVETAGQAGLELRSYEHQGRYLGKLGLAWLAALEGRRPDAATQALVRQFHSLTHPAMMGRSFRVVELEKP